MKNTILSAALSLFFLFWSASSSFAESVAVEGDLAFIADEGLVAKNISTGQVNQCLAAPLLDPMGIDVTDLLGTATDVVIVGSNAIVTTHPVTETGPVVDVVAVDVSNCLIVDEVIEVAECVSTVSIEEGILIIPCVEINGVVNTVHMNRRGNSSNWEVTFLGNNPALANFHDSKKGKR
tara:strand:- start:1989 stop:2525 length:537 start_codon:yes stop_codon:yes gene_type:complete